MKKIVKLLACVMGLSIALTGCGAEKVEKKVEIQTIVDSVKSEVKMRQTQKLDKEAYEKIYGINDEMAEEVFIENGIINDGIETIAIVKCKDGKVEDVKKAFEKFVETKKQPPAYPQSIAAAEEAKISVQGNYVALFIIPDHEGDNPSQKAQDIFTKAFE